MNREKFMRFFNKKDLDYSTGEIHPYDFHTTFYILIKMFRVLDKKPLPKWTLAVPIAVCCTGTLALISFSVTLWERIVVDFNLIGITEAGTYHILMIYKLLMVSCPIIEKEHYYKFLKIMKEDYNYICSSGSKYREKYFEQQMSTWKASILSSLFMCGIGGGMILFAIVALIFFFFYQPEGSVRPLMFPLWAGGLDDSKTPVYECMMAFSISAVFTHCMIYIFFLQTQMVWSRQITSKADIIIWSIEDFLVDIQPTSDKDVKKYYERIIMNRMAEIIKMHQSMYEMLGEYSAVYKKVLMFEQKLCAPVVCLTAFCAAEKLDMGEIPAFDIMLCMSVIILSCIPSYMCTILAEKIEQVGDACWNCPFWNAPAKVIRPYLVLMMQRSKRPLPIQAAGFSSVSLETFASNLTAAYSWFNMLRQANVDMKGS